MALDILLVALFVKIRLSCLCPSLFAPAAVACKDLTRSYLCKRPSAQSIWCWSPWLSSWLVLNHHCHSYTRGVWDQLPSGWRTLSNETMSMKFIGKFGESPWGAQQRFCNSFWEILSEYIFSYFEINSETFSQRCLMPGSWILLRWPWFLMTGDDDDPHNSTVTCKDLQKSLKTDDLEISAI